MPRQFRPKKDLNLERMFETRSDAWAKVGLSFEVNEREVRNARNQLVLLLPLIIALDVATHLLLDPTRHQVGRRNIRENFLQFHDLGWGQTPVRLLSIVLVIVLGWGIARAVGRFVGPVFMRRMDPATAGTFGFVLRLVTMAVALVLALGVAGVPVQDLAVGGAFTAVILGLAAQQTLGNVIAGMVLLSARPFRVGERVRFQAGVVGGTVEGIVSSLGLLYTNLSQGNESIMVPNNTVLASIVMPIREPDSVDVKVRLSSGVRPSQVQAILEQEIAIPTRSGTSVVLEEVDGKELVVRVQATPEMPDEGAKLADEIMGALAAVTSELRVANGNGKGNGNGNGHGDSKDSGRSRYGDGSSGYGDNTPGA